MTGKETLMSYSQLNENIKHAILLRKEKDKQTDFYRKLQTLNDRIWVYKELFMNKKPRILDFKYQQGSAKPCFGSQFNACSLIAPEIKESKKTISKLPKSRKNFASKGRHLSGIGFEALHANHLESMLEMLNFNNRKSSSSLYDKTPR